MTANRCLLHVVTALGTLVVVPASAGATDVVLKSLHGATLVSADRGYAVWSAYNPAAKRFKLVVTTPGGSRTLDLGKRQTPFDATVGQSSAREVVLWSSCQQEPHTTLMAVRPLPDFSTGRGCALRSYDVSRRTTHTVPTGRGSVFLPAMAPEGRVFFFRKGDAGTQIISQSLGGKGRRVETRVAGSPTSLAATGGGEQFAYTTAVADDDGNRSTLVFSDDGVRRVVDRRVIGSITGGVQLTSAGFTADHLTWLFAAGAKSVSSFASADNYGMSGPEMSSVPHAAVSAAAVQRETTLGTASGTALIATATVARSAGGCPPDFGPDDQPSPDKHSGCSILLSSTEAPPPNERAAIRAVSYLKLRDAGPVGRTVYGDGVRYVASIGAPPLPYAGDGVVTVLNTHTGKSQTVPGPKDCTFMDMHRGTLLWGCGAGSEFEHAVTYDVINRKAAMLPAVMPGTSGFEAARYQAVGDHWARALFLAYHSSAPVYINRDTGEQRQLQLRGDQIADLDQPTLQRRLCSGERRAGVPSSDGPGIVFADDLARSGNRAAATTYEDVAEPRGTVELQQCGKPVKKLKTCITVGCSQPVITSRVVAWTENHGKPKREGRLVVRSLKSGRTRYSAWRTDAMSLLLLGSRVYVISEHRLLRASI